MLIVKLSYGELNVEWYRTVVRCRSCGVRCEASTAPLCGACTSLPSGVLLSPAAHRARARARAPAPPSALPSQPSECHTDTDLPPIPSTACTTVFCSCILYSYLFLMLTLFNVYDLFLYFGSIPSVN